jgi:sulfatase maturation enzyme AslB (radical SAM superfamily)
MLLPQIDSRGVHTQVVTSAFRVIPGTWMSIKRLNIVVSVDGLQPEHDARRKPATYERILQSIREARVTIHCTITSQIAERPGYLDEFLRFWTAQPSVVKVWFSIFTPQRGANDAEILSPSQRAATIAELKKLRVKYPALEMPESLIREIEFPPKNPKECIFARTTQIISADLKTQVTPCQFGGNPDCEQCGCIASMALAAVGHHRVASRLTAGHLFMASDRLGKAWRNLLGKRLPRPMVLGRPSPFNILEP